MAKKVIRLNEEDFYRLVKKVANEEIDEIGGRTYARVHNATIKAQQNQQNENASDSTRKNSNDIISQGISIDPHEADLLITPYKANYLFHCTNLRGTAAITMFSLKQLYRLRPDKAILKGDVTFNGEPLSGSITIDMKTKKVNYNYKGRKPSYELLIDPSGKQLWNELVSKLEISLETRNI